MEKKKFKFIEGTATKELVKHIPIENLKFYYFLFGAIRTCSIQALTDFNYTKKGKDVKEALRQLIEGKATKRYATKKISEILCYGLLEGMVKKRLKTSHRPSDDALYILLYALRFDLTYYTGRPKYKLISDFLAEQGIDKEITYDDVKRKLRKVSKKPICHILAGYQDGFDVITEAFDMGNLQGIYSVGFYSHFNEYDTLYKTSFTSSLKGGNKSPKNW